ncbi:MAG: BBP7 family outer membrane beta-barrel protein [Planctomycetota bacterium]
MSVGYNLLVLSSVYRPGAWMDPTFDGSTLGAAPDPAATSTLSGSSDNLILHGLSFGLSYNF